MNAALVARKLADACEAKGIEYGIGGALALGVWGFPRATKDVDIDVFVEPPALHSVFDVLRGVGCSVDAAQAEAQAVERGDFQAWFGDMRVDVFVPSIPFYESIRRRLRRAPLEGREAWFLSPEDLAVMKFLFFRSKDLIDVERLVAFGGAAFDRAYVSSALTDIVGADDARLTRWQVLLADVDAQRT
ncbi:MAG: hypothetical protein JNM17_15480 [Archangium sp.]|nr:hypothetical protein [Archangium sp.]